MSNPKMECMSHQCHSVVPAVTIAANKVAVVDVWIERARPASVAAARLGIGGVLPFKAVRDSGVNDCNVEHFICNAVHRLPSYSLKYESSEARTSASISIR